jgi:tetratricopeptide (TPR) repeat protein
MPDAVPGNVIDALVEWSWVRHRLAQFEGTLPALERAESIAREIGDKARLASALSWIANHHIVTGFPSRSVPFMRESSQLARELGNEQLLLLPLFFGTWSLVDRDPAAAVDRLQEIIDLARQYDDIDIEGHAISYRAIAFARMGDFTSARAEIEKAVAILPRTAAPVKRADIHIGIGMAYHDMGELDQALWHSREGARLAEGAHGLECACAGYFGVGRVELDRNNPDAALVEFNQSLKFSDLSGFEGFLAAIRGSAAVAEFKLGNDAAVERLRTARDNARSLNDDYAAAVLTQQLAEAYLRLNRLDEATEALTTATSYYRAAGMRPYIANALDVEARLFSAKGHLDEAAKARSEAETFRASMPVPHPAVASRSAQL